MCIDCIFENHSGHKGIKLNIIEDIYKEKIKNELNKINSISSDYINLEINLRHKVDDMKIKISNMLEDFYQNFIKKVKNENNMKEDEGLKIIKENYPPKNKEQLIMITEELLNIYNNVNEKKEEVIKGKKYFDDYKNLINEKMDSFVNYLKKFSDLDNKQRFEWTKTTYGSYEFYYQLEEDNTKVAKILKGGTITICRGNIVLEKGNKYKLEYDINYTKGDFDVGFGDEKAGLSCWLRDENSYSFTSSGIYLKGKLIQSDKKLASIKNITFIIDLKIYQADLFIDGQKQYNFSISKDLIYYPMIAIRELNNSVKLKFTNISDNF